MIRAALILLLAGGAAHAAHDYAPGSTEWNGLSKLVELARASGCELRTEDELDWSSLQKTDVLWFIYPRVPVEPGKLSRFLAGGGRALIADDFGAAASALEKSLRLHRAQVPLAPEVERYHENPNLPLARSRSQTVLGRSAAALVSNHPMAFQTGGLPAAFAFSRGDALVVEEHFQGGGYAVALADPSVLINNMLEITEFGGGNRAFASTLLGQMCRGQIDKIHLFTQTFVSRGEPPSSLYDRARPGSGAARFNELVNQFNQSARAATSDRRATLLFGLSAGLVASFLLLSAFPARGLHHDLWTQLGQHPRLKPPAPTWDLAGPMGALRAEVLERLTVGGSVELAALDSPALVERVQAKHGAQAGRHAGQLWRLFKKIRWRDVNGEIVPDERIARRQLLRAYALASALFDDLKRS